MPRKQTKDQILDIARDILANEGLGAVSFDAIARCLGRSKQAVLYWFPTKHDLLAALFLPWLEAEADTAIAALDLRETPAQAIGAFVRAISAFHFTDLDRFRMMYLVPQTLKPTAQPTHQRTVLEQVHPVTDRLYSAFADNLDGHPATARQHAVAIHSAVLGMVLMVGLGDSLNDPLKHGQTALVEALIARLT